MVTYLQFRSLEKRYGRVCALADVDLQVEQGSVLALLGPNGAGKTTLFGCLLGLVRPTGGEIHLRGKPIAEANRCRFGYVAERVALYPQRTVRENGMLFARLKNQSAAELECQLKRVGLYTAQDRPVCQLSKGMLQRLGLAIALCGKPELLVLDEPFNGLDPALLDGLQGILREEQARGATLLISTHTMSAVEPLATHVAILLQGRLALCSRLETLRAQHAEEGSLEAIYHRIARQQQPGNLEVLAA
jgi:ABC-2 type transport system ATP-binding protein